MKKACNGCENLDGELVMMPYIAHEAEMTRADKDKKRLWIVILVLIFMLVGTNLAWLIYESQFETFNSWEIEQHNENGYNNIIGNDGDIIYGDTNN